MALKQQHRETPSGSEAAASRRCGIREHDVEIELTEGEPTTEQQLAYERFWSLFMERVVRSQQLDINT